MAGFNKLMRYCNTLAEYEQAKTDGIINDDVLVIVLDEKVAKFKGQTFDWGGCSVIVDTELSGTSTNAVQNKVVKDALDSKQDKEEGKGLSSNDYSDSDKSKVDSLVNIVQAVATGDILDDVDVRYATEQYVDDAIAQAIISTLNTEV